MSHECTESFRKANRKFLTVVLILFGIVSISVVGLVYYWMYGINNHEPELRIQLLTQVPMSRFDDLTHEEMMHIRNFTMKALNLRQISDAGVNDDYIYHIYLREPRKINLRNEPDQLHSLTDRFAIVVVFYGKRKEPTVQEYLVGPLMKNKKSEYSITSKRIVEFSKRPFSSPEYREVINTIMHTIGSLKEILNRFYNITQFPPCRGPQCLKIMYATPHVYPNSNYLNNKHRGCITTRCTWFRCTRNMTPFYHYLIDLQMLVEHSGVDISQWKIKTVWFRGKCYKSAAEIVTRFSLYDNYSMINSFRKPNHMPSYEYHETLHDSLRDRNVSKFIKTDEYGFLIYKSWRLKVAFRSAVGLRLFMITFNKMSIAYEVGLSETATLYSGGTPYMTNVFSIESYFGVGSYTFNQIPVVDCPVNSVYFSTWVFHDGEPRFIKRAICAFEWKMLSPLFRHRELNFDDLDGSSSESYIGNPLVIRSVCTLFNYDYIFDYIFHDNGAIEIAVTATGHAHIDIVMPISSNVWKNYGFVIPSNTSASYEKPDIGDSYAPIHLHLFHFKVDLDVVEIENNINILRLQNHNGYFFETFEPKYESEAVLTDSSGDNHYLICSSIYSKRCYRILNRAETKSLPPTTHGYEMGLKWAKTNIVATVAHDNESLSSIFYNGVNPLDPVVDFEDFISNNESIEHEDLILWIKMGSLHIPHNEDFPCTTTSGGRLQTFLLPNNYFRCIPRTGHDC